MVAALTAIAEWVRDEAPGARPACGDVIQRLHWLADGVDIDALGDREALDLFSEVLGALETSDAEVFGSQDDDLRADESRH